MIEYKKIPFFTRYAIAKTGEVINYQSLRTVKNVDGRVNLTSDRGDRTTKRPHLMVRELFNQEMEKSK